MSFLQRILKSPAVLGAGAVAAVLGAGFLSVHANEAPVKIPAPLVDESVMMTDGLETIVLAGGCFWGVQGVFQHTAGVESAVSGYSGGTAATATYPQVGMGNTGHAEVVEVKFDPKKVSLGKILHIFFSVAHNPTQLNYQGNDIGPQYRSAIFTTSESQAKVAAAYIAQLDKAKVYGDPIVTELAPLKGFYKAEDYHQDYATLHPEEPYIYYNDLPKIAALKEMFAEVWRDKPKLVFAPKAS